MKCPKCKNCGSKVVDTRRRGDDERVRRRECKHCKFRFNTLEKLSEDKKLWTTEK